LACDGSGRAPSCCSTSSCSGPRSIATLRQKRRPFAPHPSTSAAPDFAAPPRSGSPRRSAGSARKRKGERFVHTSLLYCQVPWLCCVRVRGADAYDFLQRQLTNNPPATSDRFVLAAWNDAKGRVRSLFRVVRGGDGPMLVAERDGIDAVLAKLRIFVLRSDVAFEKSDDLEVGAVLGDSRTLLPERGIDLGPEPGAAARADGLVWLRLGAELLHVIGRRPALDGLRASLEPAASELAARAEIRAGLPLVGARLAERYVPQMLNLDRL